MPLADPPAKARSWRRFALRTLGAIVVVCLVGDFIYARIVAHQAQQWEASVERDANGVLVGCEAYTLTPTANEQPAENQQPAEQDASSSDAHDVALLMVHGINASPQHYAKLAPRMAELGYTCRVMRLPGFAEPLKEYAQSTRRDWSVAIQAELTRLRKTHNRVGVMAHSLGGAATIVALLEDPQAADVAVLLAPAVAVSDARSPLLPTHVWHAIGRRTLVFVDTVRSPFDIDSHDPANINHPGRTPFTPQSVLNELFDLMHENERRGSDFQTPLLMVLTNDDVVIDTPAAKTFFESVAAPEKQLLMLENSGHAIPLDYDWPLVAEATDRFCKRMLATDR